MKTIHPKSATTTEQAKRTLLHYYWSVYLKAGIPFQSMAEMIKHKFEMTMFEYFCKPFTENDRKLFYRVQGKYGNNRPI